jgi:hypothetical protein
MAQRNQRGWLKRESRTYGETWVLFLRRTRKSHEKPATQPRSIRDPAQPEMHVPSNQPDPQAIV